jgi:transmembrane sensor
MPANPIRLEELFDKYVRGSINPEEFTEFWHLVKEMQASDTLSAKLTALWCEWETKAQPGSGPDRSKVFTRIMEKGREREIDFEKLRIHPITRRSRLLAAAAVVGTVLTGLYLLYSGKTAPAAATPQYAAVQTKSPDYTRNIVLPDGSTVVLHAGSTLDYPAAFPAGSREVSLKGEAYFDVRHDDKKPFIIHTGKVSTTVLGTAFNISSDSNKVTISVTGGKVRVENGKKVLAELTPNQQIVYRVPEEATEKRMVNAEQLVTNWTKQDMVFDGDSFGEIAEVVGRRYGISIRFKNPELAKCLIVASFSGTETLENVLEMLCTIRNASYVRKQEGNEIEIDGKGCE